MDVQIPKLNVVSRDQLNLSIRVVGDREYLRFAKMSTGAVSVNIGMESEQEVDHFLTPKIVDPIRELLWRIIGVRSDVTFPELRLSVPGLLVAECVATYRADPSGGHDINLHFRQVFGNVQALFRANVMAMNCVRDEANDIVVDSLESALIPIFDLGEYVRQQLRNSGDASEQAIADAMAGLVARIDSLELSFEMFKRCDEFRPGPMCAAQHDLEKYLAAG